jgi:uncharacterized protein (TIGR03067 family)
MKTKSYLLGFLTITALAVMIGCSTMRESDSAKLQGIWKGKAMSDDEIGTFTISGKKFEFRGDKSGAWYQGTFSLREDTQPKQFIAHITDTGFPQYVGKTTVAIYKIEDKTLTIAGDEPGTAGPPTAFDAPGAASFVLKKQ